MNLSPKVNRPNAGFEVEISAITEFLNVMYSATKLLDPNTKSGKMLLKTTHEEVNIGVGNALYLETKKRGAAKEIAHVFDWHSVIDRTPDAGRTAKSKTKESKVKVRSGWDKRRVEERKVSTTTYTDAGPRKRTAVAKKRRQDEKNKGKKTYTDTAVKYVPKIKPKAPLYFLRNVGRGKNVRAVVGFLTATETEYDKEVYHMELYRPEGLGSHWFQDQATQLEKVSIIRKHGVSKRRTGGGGGFPGGRTGPRIIQPFGKGQNWYPRNFSTYQRENKFQNKFAQFFMSFSSTKVPNEAVRAMKRIEKDVGLVYLKEIDRIETRQSHAGSLMSIGSVVSTFGRGGTGIRVSPLKLTNYGKQVKTIPPPTDNASVRIAIDVNNAVIESSPPAPKLMRNTPGEIVRVQKHLQEDRERLSRPAPSGTWSWSN
jgi:hypothetical protein